MPEINFNNFHEAQSLEWLDTNGLGGWASSTVLNCNTRSYHGILVAAIGQPSNRFVVLSRLDESLKINKKTHLLASRDFADTVYPTGYNYLRNFSNFPCPSWTFSGPDFILKKSLLSIDGSNSVCLRYELQSDSEAELQLEPFVAFRDYHATRHNNSGLQLDLELKDAELNLLNSENNLKLCIKGPFCAYLHNPIWYNNFFLREEASRGLVDREDLLCTGQMYFKLKAGEPVYILVSADKECPASAAELFEIEARRRTGYQRQNKQQTSKKIASLLENLEFRADQFIVPRNTKKTILAGYHWFADWGRDCLISMRGLCLARGRLDQAQEILDLFCSHIQDGLIPNRFVEHGEKPDYNSVDASLWLGVVAWDFFQSGGDLSFVKDKLFPALQKIFEAFCQGTKYGISEDSDGLIRAGNASVQLTWMDAKIGNWVVTPRHGKAVEINAMWYNLLKVLEFFSEKFGEQELAEKLKDKISLTYNSFEKTFYNEAGGYLFDVVGDDFKDPSVRPNQIFAAALEFCPLSKKVAAQVIQMVRKELLTVRGLRTLSPVDQYYRGRCEGNGFNRDSAYHQGTIWPWLLGLYVDALFKFEPESAGQEAIQIVEAMYDHLNEACLGSISEIFDGDSPHYPRGTVSQAWSVSEVLRICLQYKL